MASLRMICHDDGRGPLRAPGCFMKRDRSDRAAGASRARILAWIPAAGDRVAKASDPKVDSTFGSDAHSLKRRIVRCARGDGDAF